MTFADPSGVRYFPAPAVVKSFHLKSSYDPALELLTIGKVTVDPFAPKLSDGTYLLSSKELLKIGIRVGSTSLNMGKTKIPFQVGEKRVKVDLQNQVLQAWQGGQLIYRWKVSSGREGKETPNGNYKAGKKEKMHISTIYGSPMPYSVHLAGNIFIHGSTLIGSTPGSHGCIRLPVMTTRNVAEEFYNWIDIGTPVTVIGNFSFDKKTKKAP